MESDSEHAGMDYIDDSKLRVFPFGKRCNERCRSFGEILYEISNAIFPGWNVWRDWQKIWENCNDINEAVMVDYLRFLQNKN